MREARKRFLLIGLDGADPALMGQWMDAGRMPACSALRARGSFMPLQSTTPPVTLPAWTTCVTGVNPGRHGIFDFTQMSQDGYGIRFVNSTFRKAPALWNVLSDAGWRVCVLGVPGTYPPERVNGIMLAGFDSPVATAPDVGFAYPRERWQDLRAWRFADFQESNIGPGWHARALPILLRQIETKERMACDLLREEPWDFFMIVFGESDTASHHFWLHHDAHSPRHRPGHETAIRDVYERLDAAVAALIEAAGEDVAVGVVSDHGFGGAGTGVVHLNNWLAQEGYLHFAGGARSSMLKALALKAVPERRRGALFRRMPQIAARAESKSRFAGIDWRQTRAYSEELNYFPSIRINLQGREPEGQVAPENYDAVVRELCARLEAWEAVARAWPRDALYEGRYVDRAPDIILELALEGGYSHSCLRSRGGPPFRRLREDEFLGGKEHGMNGTHRPLGVCLFSEGVCDQLQESPPRGGETGGVLDISDIAPIVLATMGLSADDMAGSPRLPHSQEEDAYTPEEEAELEERLRDLGYLE